METLTKKIRFGGTNEAKRQNSETGDQSVKGQYVNKGAGFPRTQRENK